MPINPHIIVLVRRVLWLLLALCLLRFVMSLFIGVHVDEAYYWMWSRHLSWGYYDHPPLIAWLIALGDLIFRRFNPWFLFNLAPEFFAQLGLRVFPLLLSAVATPLLLLKSIEILQKNTLSGWQVAALLTAPVFVFGPQIVTPDTPLFFFWSALLYFCVKMREQNSTTDSDNIKHGLILGVLLGFAGLSKYTAVLSLIGVIFARLRWKVLVIAAICAFFIILPHLYWQATTGLNNDAGIFFQLKHGFGTPGAPIKSQYLGDLLATQFLFWTPLVLVTSLFYWVTPALRKQGLWLASWSLFPLLFFSYAALRQPAEGNWPWVGVLGALVLLIATGSNQKTWHTTIVANHLTIGIIATILIFHSAVFAPLFRSWQPAVADALERPSRLHEFEHWGQLRQDLFELCKTDTLPIKVQTYQVLAEMSFYDSLVAPEAQLGDRLKLWNEGSRRSEFNLIPDYLAEGIQSYYLLVQGADPRIKDPCPLVKLINKGSTNPRPFKLLKCG